MKNIADQVFVYGTLKQGFPNFATNRGRRVPGHFVTVQAYPLYLVGPRCTPWMLDLPGQGQPVAGQLFEVDDTTLRAMDLLERVAEPDGYRRVRLQVKAQPVGPGPQVTRHAWAYLQQPHRFDPVHARSEALAEYTLQHAALYRPRRAAPGSSAETTS